MSDYVKNATEAGDQVLAGIAEAQDSIIKAMQPYTEWASTQTKMPSPKNSLTTPISVSLRLTLSLTGIRIYTSIFFISLNFACWLLEGIT